jgi:acylphosphatase
MKKRIECRVWGRVQMVMYRDFATRTARKLGLFGEVWNVSDGSVCVIAEGEEQSLEVFVARLQKGSLLSRVEKVLVEERDIQNNYTNFSIRYK